MTRFPALDPHSIVGARDALHAYARILGDCLKATREKRKHWWHASLRPSLNGLTTGVVHSSIDFEIELNMRQSTINVHTSTAEPMCEALTGQPAAELRAQVFSWLESAGVPPLPGAGTTDTQSFVDYSSEEANRLALALSAVSAALVDFRTGIREETSPIQVWPHHFDLSMIWLPGQKVSGEDPVNEEYADKQMNFGFVFGDEGIEEPYFYVTAYPLPDAVAQVELPKGTTWKGEGFSGAVLLYKDLVAMDDPAAYLQYLWSTLLAAGQAHLATND